jgi:iron complex outermembrane receptor protein
VQVLKGPQGSLYGQNAAGGAIIIDTVAPSFTPKGKFSAGFGNYSSKLASGWLAGPINQQFAFAIAAAYQEHGGYSENLLAGGHDKGLRSGMIRGKVLWQPNDDISLTASAYKSRRFETASYSGPALNGNSTGRGVMAALFPTLPLATYGLTYSSNGTPHTLQKLWGASLLGKFKIGDWGTLNTVSAYNNVNFFYTFDIDRSPVNYLDYRAVFPDSYFVQEVNFISNKIGKFTFTTGAFFMHRKASYEPNDAYFYPFPPFAPPTAYPAYPSPLFTAGGTHTLARKDSYAAYLEVSYDITDQLSITAAGRYSYETDKVWNTPLPASYRYGISPLPPLLGDPRGGFHFSKFTPKAVLRYKLNRDNSFYASYSQGFKSGFVNNANVNVCNPQPSCIDPPVRPEVVKAYEVGYKGRPLANLTFEASAFHYKYQDIQIFIYNPPAASSYQNAAVAKIYGFELSSTYQATPDLTLNAGVAYTHAKYANFKNAAVYEPLPNGGNIQTSEDASGHPMIRTPRWSMNGSVNYGHDIGDAGRAELFVSGYYASRVYYDANSRVSQAGYATMDAELSFAPTAIKGLRFVLWGKNLTDKIYLISVLEGAPADGVSFADPRTFGARIDYQF